MNVSLSRQDRGVQVVGGKCCLHPRIFAPAVWAFVAARESSTPVSLGALRPPRLGLPGGLMGLDVSVKDKAIVAQILSNQLRSLDMQIGRAHV